MDTDNDTDNTVPDDRRLVSREDIPFEASMALVQAVRELHPDKEVVFAGDATEEQAPELQEFLRELDEACHKSITTGTCWGGCGKSLPGYSEWLAVDCAGDQPELPEGWGVIEFHGDDTRAALECPDCNGPALGDKNFGIVSLNVKDGDATVEFLKIPEVDREQMEP